MSPKQNQQRNKAVFLFGLCPQKINNHLKTNIINGYYEQYSRLHMKIKIKQIVEKFHRNISLFCVILKVCKLFVWLSIKCQKFCWNILWLQSQLTIMLSRTVRRQKENHSQWSWIYVHTYPFGPLHLVPIYYLVSRSICKCLGRVFLFFCFFFFLCFCILIELQGRSCWQSEEEGIEFSIDGKAVPGRVCFCGVGGVRGVLQVSAINL